MNKKKLEELREDIIKTLVGRRNDGLVTSFWAGYMIVGLIDALLEEEPKEAFEFHGSHEHSPCIKCGEPMIKI